MEPHTKTINQFNNWMQKTIKSKFYWDHKAMLRAYRRLKTHKELKDLNYYRSNCCKEDYINTPISVLRYVKELEKFIKSKDL